MPYGYPRYSKPVVKPVVPTPAPRPDHVLLEEERQHNLRASLVRNRLGSSWNAIVIPAVNAGRFAPDM